MTAEVPEWIAELDELREAKGKDIGTRTEVLGKLDDAYPRLRAEAIRAARLEEALQALLDTIDTEIEIGPGLDSPPLPFNIRKRAKAARALLQEGSDER